MLSQISSNKYYCTTAIGTFWNSRKCSSSFQLWRGRWQFEKYEYKSCYTQRSKKDYWNFKEFRESYCNIDEDSNDIAKYCTL